MPKEVLRAFSVRVPPAQLKLITAWAAKQPVPPTISEAIGRLAEIGMQNPTGVLHRILGAISETTHEKIGADPLLQKKIAERLKALLPHAEGPKTYDKAAHFLQDDRGPEIATDVAAITCQSLNSASAADVCAFVGAASAFCTCA